MSVYDTNIKRDVEELNRLLNIQSPNQNNADNNNPSFPSLHTSSKSPFINSLLTALRTKPFVLLAGISGTGKSRIVRALAKSCWPQDSKERTAHKPRNYEMVQVRPNWHDSSELLGYVSRIGGGRPAQVCGTRVGRALCALLPLPRRDEPRTRGAVFCRISVGHRDTKT